MTHQSDNRHPRKIDRLLSQFTTQSDHKRLGNFNGKETVVGFSYIVNGLR